MGKLAWGVKAKHGWALSTNIFVQKVCWQCPAMLGQKNKNKKFKCSRLLEGDGIESRLPFKIFSTLFTGYVFLMRSSHYFFNSIKIWQLIFIWIYTHFVYLKLLKGYSNDKNLSHVSLIEEVTCATHSNDIFSWIHDFTKFRIKGISILIGWSIKYCKMINLFYYIFVNWWMNWWNCEFVNCVMNSKAKLI